MSTDNIPDNTSDTESNATSVDAEELRYAVDTDFKNETEDNTVKNDKSTSTVNIVVKSDDESMKLKKDTNSMISKVTGLYETLIPMIQKEDRIRDLARKDGVITDDEYRKFAERQCSALESVSDSLERLADKFATLE